MAKRDHPSPSELWLFTQHFPYGHGEAFLENELPYLAKGFDHVRLFPWLATGEARGLPLNVTVERLFTPTEAHRPMALWRLPAVLPSLMRLWRTARKSAPSTAVFKRNRRELLSQARQLLERERTLRLRMGNQFKADGTSLYSYWANDWATVLGLWKMHDKRVRFRIRMHGFDLFAERASDGWQRFQPFHVEQAEKILVVSQAGMDDLLARYPNERHTFQLSRLGTSDHGLAPWKPAPELRIVSCSNLIGLKRVALIAESLRQVAGPVHWTHFGDGPERSNVEALVKTLPLNVHVDLMGSRPNAEVIAWYTANPVDVFVHASSSEGLPVSLQEAASFGVPMIAADAGGVREIVNGATGTLLPLALTPEMLAETLTAFKRSGWNTAEARERVRAFWSLHFKASDAYGRLVDELKQA